MKNLFFAKDGIATTRPKKIEIIIETKEIKIVVVKPLNKNLRFVNPSTLFGDKISQFKSLLPQDVKNIAKNNNSILFTL